MHLMDRELAELVARSKECGYVTYDEVNSYLPDEDENPEKLNKLIEAVERYGIRLVDGDSFPIKPSRRPEPNVRDMRADVDANPKSTDDEILRRHSGGNRS